MDSKLGVSASERPVLEAKVDYLITGLELLKDDIDDKVEKMNRALGDLRSILNRLRAPSAEHSSKTDSGSLGQLPPKETQR